MKKLLIIACAFCAISANAQNGFYLQPEVGAGISATNAEFSSSPWNHTWPATSIFTYNAQLGVGYSFNHWSVSSGLSYLRSGYKRHYRGMDPAIVDYYLTEYDYHLMVPVVVAYDFKLCNHFTFSPGVGCGVSYNSSVTQTIDENFGATFNRQFTGKRFDDQYNRIGTWGIVKATLGYKLNQQLQIVAGPEAQIMLNSINKNMKQNNHTVMLNAGVKWSFRNSKQRPQIPSPNKKW